MSRVMKFTGIENETACPKCGEPMFVETGLVKPYNTATSKVYATTIERIVMMFCDACGLKFEYGYDRNDLPPGLP